LPLAEPEFALAGYGPPFPRAGDGRGANIESVPMNRVWLRTPELAAELPTGA
jgi:hypothetical protein